MLTLIHVLPGSYFYNMVQMKLSEMMHAHTTFSSCHLNTFIGQTEPFIYSFLWLVMRLNSENCEVIYDYGNKTLIFLWGLRSHNPLRLCWFWLNEQWDGFKTNYWKVKRLKWRDKVIIAEVSLVNYSCFCWQCEKSLDMHRKVVLITFKRSQLEKNDGGDEAQ